MQPSDDSFEAKFTLESDKSGVVEERPFYILMLGDWSGDGEKPELRSRRPIEIDRDNFDEVIKRLGVAADLGDITLQFGRIDDFHPDEIYRRVQTFSELRDLRRRLKNPDTYNSAAREVRSLVGSDDSSSEGPVGKDEREASEPADNLLDAILSSPSGGAPKPRTGVSSELGDLISDLVRPHLVSVDEGEQASLLSAVDSATGDLMRRILHERRFQDLEAAWRGLYFQVRRTETASNLKIFILDATKDELAADLKTAGELENSFLFSIAENPHDGEAWAAIFGNYAFEPTVDDIAALIRVSQIAASINSPFVSHMRPDVLGVHSLEAHPDHREWKISETDEAKLWSALRSRPESKYLGMAVPRFLARLPYGSDSDPLETFTFEEFTPESGHDRYLWANPCFLIALLYAQSFSTDEWNLGDRLKQDIEGLPTHVYKQAGETVYQPCAEIQMTQAGSDKLMEFGLMPLVSFKDTDHVRIARFQSVSEPPSTLKGRWS